MTPVHCVICGVPLRMAVAAPPTTYAARGAYGVAECPSCGLGQTSPMPSEEDLRALYANDYGYGTHDLVAPEKRWRAAHVLRRVLSPGDDRLLDVGCMQGFLLDEARAKGVSRCQGIELSSGPASEARAKGHSVFGGTIEAFAAQAGATRFDVIVAQHVLEHIVDLASFLRTARGLLSPRGRLCLCVPNFGSRLRRAMPGSWGWYQVPAHVHHFTLPSISLLLEREGFHVDRSYENGGDTLFLMMTGATAVARRAPTRSATAPSLPLRLGLRAGSRVLRSYFHVGDDELMVVASATRAG